MHISVNGGSVLRKILILGAGGFIGKAVVAELANKYVIKAFDRNKVAEFLKFQNVEMLTGDFVHCEHFDDLLADVGVVLHLISTTVPSDVTHHIPEEIEENVVTTINLLESMVRCGVMKIIFASSAGTVYGETGEKINNVHSLLNPRCSYGVQKCVIEKYLEFYARRYGLDVKIMRITNPYGWGQDSNKIQGLIPIFINKFLKGEAITVFGDGSHKRDYLFITDLARAFSKVIDYKGRENIFNVGYGEYYSINDIIAFIEDKMGGRFTKIIYAGNRFCDVHQSYVDVSVTKKELEWQPEISMHEGIEMTINKLRVNANVYTEKIGD